MFEKSREMRRGHCGESEKVALVAVLRVPFVGADYGFRPVSLACCQRSGCHMDTGPKEMVVYKFGILPEVKTREVRESQD